MADELTEFIAERVTASRTFIVRDESAEGVVVVLRIETGDARHSFLFCLEEFPRFAKQMAADAALLLAPKGDRPQ